MITSEILTKGVEEGIITAEQAERLRALQGVREPPELPASPDDEQLRFISGFSDIFVTIGLAMFLGAIGYFAQQSGGKLGLTNRHLVTRALRPRADVGSGRFTLRHPRVATLGNVRCWTW